jgi:basic membrane protein A
MGDALATVASQFPKTNFAIIDFPWEALKGKPANARGLVFAEQQAGYLAGVAAATTAGSGAVSAVGGQKVPAVVAFLAGYRAGAKATGAQVRVIEGYSEDFVDQAKCKEVALTQLEAGSKVVFAAAGGCGLGALQAAKEHGAWGIGVDSDQSFLGPYILTSATKKVDVAVSDTVAKVVDGTFEGGGNTLYDIANDGVGYGKVSERAPDRDALIAKLDDVSKQIADGDIDVPRP